MSHDEVLAAVAAVAVAAFAWWGWLWGVFGVTWLGAPRGQRVQLVAVPVVCLALIYAILARWAASDVRDSTTYMAFYLLLGLAWLGLCARLMHLGGISPRDDVVERRNPAAAWAVAGGLLAVALCYAGGNIGDGPGWWVVVFAAGLATAALGLIGGFVAAAGRLAERITVERELAAGVRYGCLLVACGLILGRAVAGDWVSAAATVTDFAVVARPVFALAAIEVVLGRALPITGGSVFAAVAVGLLPGCGYLFAAGAYVAQQGLG